MVNLLSVLLGTTVLDIRTLLSDVFTVLMHSRVFIDWLPSNEQSGPNTRINNTSYTYVDTSKGDVFPEI